MHLFEFTLLDAGASAKLCRLRHWAGGTIETAEPLLDLGEHGGMIDSTGGCDHDVGRAVIAAEIIAQLAGIERTDRARCTEDGAAERLIGEGDFVQVLEN